MPPVPLALDLAFGLTTALTLGLLLWAAPRHWRALVLEAGKWLVWQAVLAWTGFYTVTNTLPPRFALVVGPPLLLLAGLLATARGRRFLDALRPDRLTLLHAVRVPVELVLFGLYHYQAVPRLMTFEGRNWDILMGLSAPLVYYAAYRLPPSGAGTGRTTDLERGGAGALGQHRAAGAAVRARAVPAVCLRAAQRGAGPLSLRVAARLRGARGAAGALGGAAAALVEQRLFILVYIDRFLHIPAIFPAIFNPVQLVLLVWIVDWRR